MIKPLTLLASLALAGTLGASVVAADEPFCATINSIDSITLNDSDGDACQLILNLTLPSGQTYVLPVETSGNQLCVAFEGKFLSGASGFEACGFYQLAPLYVYVEEITQGTLPETDDDN
jgi:hypothetical protein